MPNIFENNAKSSVSVKLVLIIKTDTLSITGKVVLLLCNICCILNHGTGEGEPFLAISLHQPVDAHLKFRLKEETSYISISP